MLLTKVQVKNNVKLDFFHLEEASSENVDIFLNKKYKPSLGINSRFLVTFDNATTTSEGIADVALGYTFSVYRELEGSNELVYVTHVKDDNLSATDYSVVNDKSYRYYIFKEDNSAISEAVVSNNVKTCWWDWSLIDLIPSTTERDLYYVNPNNIWKFNLNISSAAKTQTLNNTVYNNLTKFPKISAGKLNYSTGGLTCLLGNVQKTTNKLVDYVEPSVMLDEWNDFCANGNIKLMKDRKGNAMLVMITNTSSQTDDITREQSNTITFNWVQVEDIKNVRIIGI